ncbi:MAG: FprA family A-type flavoprotein [Candidatus Omnitrophota bacterium]
MVKVADSIYWTGYIDWELRNFHGYSTPGGSTYNAYLIKDEKPALIDTVKYYGFDEMLRRIKQVIDPLEIKYIISNHTEMDHSGSIGKLLAICPKAEVVCSPKGEQGLKKHFDSSGAGNWKFKAVNTGDSLSIGKRTLSFYLTPMVHWPDSMVTYSKDDKILFSNDAFGQHMASPERFVDEAGLDIVLKEAAKYYANIVMPYGVQALKAIEAIKQLQIDMICPSHGLIWRRKSDITAIISKYIAWANYESQNRAVIVYDTMWHSTEKIANKLFELLDKEGLPVKIMNLKNDDPSDIVAEVMFSKVVIVGSPILNNRVFPKIAGFLGHLKGLKPKNRFGFTFGSYGWSKGGFSELEESLEESGIELIDNGAYFQYVPSEPDLNSLAGIVSKVKNILTGDKSRAGV